MENNYKTTLKKINVICIELLESFTEIELRNLQKVAACSYHNSDKAVFNLLIFIMNKILTKKLIINESALFIVYNATFSSNLKMPDFHDFHKKKLNDKFNKLARLTEKFLVLENLSSDKHQYNDLLLEKLRNKKQFDLIKRLIHKNKKNLQHATKNVEYYQHNLIIEQNQLEYYHKNETLYGDRSESIRKINYNLDLYFILYKLSIHSTLLSLQDATIENLERSTYYSINTLIDLPIYSSLPQVQIFKAAIKLLSKEQEKEYNEFIDIIQKHKKHLSINDLRGVYSIANNFLVEQRKKGVFTYNNLLDLYKDMERLNIIMDNRQTSTVKLKNIIIVSCNVGDYRWASKILDKYIKFVKKSIRISVYHLNLGIISFYQKDYNKTLSYLLKTEEVNLIYDKACRLLTLQCHFELDKEYDERSMRIFRSAEQYFKSIKPSNKIDRISYRNFFNVFINLYRIKHKIGKISLSRIKEKLFAQDYNLNKGWLLAKISELEGGDTAYILGLISIQLPQQFETLSFKQIHNLPKMAAVPDNFFY